MATQRSALTLPTRRHPRPRHQDRRLPRLLWAFLLLLLFLPSLTPPADAATVTPDEEANTAPAVTVLPQTFDTTNITAVDSTWSGSFVNNQYSRTDSGVDFNWGSGGPGIPGIGPDNFSARWERTWNFPELSASGYNALDSVWKVQLFYQSRELNGASTTCNWESSADSINKDWGTGYMVCGNNGRANDWSARWTRDFWFGGGTYSFYSGSDDGIRVYVDGNQKISDWKDGGYRQSRTEVDISPGKHTITVEFYDRSGDARVYFAMTDYSSKKEIEYNFYINADDGYKVYVNDNAIIDAWDSIGERSVKLRYSGEQKIKIEYREKGGEAKVNFWFTPVTDNSLDSSDSVFNPMPSSSSSGWSVTYYNTNDLTVDRTTGGGDAQSSTSSGNALDLNWGAGSPGVSIIGSDNFAARWTRRFRFTRGYYRFTYGSDDGLRVYVDDNKVIDNWQGQGYVAKTLDLDVAAGEHTIKIEYYEGGGEAQLFFSMSCLSCEQSAILGQWHIEESEGSAPQDSSGNGLHGVLMNDTDNYEEGAPWNLPQNTAYDFGGSRSLKIGDTRPAQLKAEGNTRFAISAWIKVRSFNEKAQIFGHLYENWYSGNSGFAIGTRSNGQLYFAVVTGSDQLDYDGPNISAYRNKWLHVVATYDPTSGRTIYLDGRQVWASSSRTGAVDYAPDNAVYIGRSTNVDGGNSFDGQIDAVRFYRRALTADEIATFSRRNTPLAWWKLDGTAEDAAAGNNGTVGNSWPSPYVTTVDAAPLGSANTGAFKLGNSYLTVPSAAIRPAKLTLAAWIYADGATWSSSAPFVSLTTSQDANGFELRPVSGSRQIQILLGGERRCGGWCTYSVVPANITGWHHYAVTQDGSYVYFYVDGQQVDSFYAALGNLTYNGTVTDLRIGASTSGSLTLAQGRVDDVRIYDRALSATEISAIGNPQPGPTYVITTLETTPYGGCGKSACSIFDAIAAATLDGPTSANMITFADNLVGTLRFNSSSHNRVGAIRIQTPLKLIGKAEAIQLDGYYGTVRLFAIKDNAEVTLEALTLQNAQGALVVSKGAKLTLAKSMMRNSGPALVQKRVSGQADTTVTISDSLFDQNVTSDSSRAGALTIEGGTLAVINSTFTRNQGGQGNVLRATGGAVQLVFSTLVNNGSTSSSASSDYRAAIYNSGATITTRAAIIANKSATNANNCYGTVTGVGNNLTDQSDRSCQGVFTNNTATLGLGGTPANNGGPTDSIELLDGSPAIGKIALADCVDFNNLPVTADQRGAPRPGPKGACDMGAFQTPRLQTVVRPTTTADAAASNRATCSLRQAVQMVNNNSVYAGCLPVTAGVATIALNAQTYRLTITGNDDGNAVGDLDLRRPMTMTGVLADGAEATVIEGSGVMRLLQVIPGSGNRVLLQNLTLAGGAADMNGVDTGGGGGVRVDSGILRITNSTLRNNSSPANGGALLVGNANVTLEQSLLLANRADSSGGGLYVNNSSATVQLINSTLSGNRAATGGALAVNAGTATLRFVTLTQNGASTGAAHLWRAASGARINLGFAAMTQPQTWAVATNTLSDGAMTSCASTNNSINSQGYNVLSDRSCSLVADSGATGDQSGITVAFAALDYNGAVTQNYLPANGETNPLVDVVPVGLCLNTLGTTAADQRGRSRPRAIKNEGAINNCDVGAIELGLELRTVCGAPLAGKPEFTDRCQYPTLRAALAEANNDDTLIVSGLITETVTVTRNVTIRGPRLNESTAGTHLGIVQASLNKHILTVAPNTKVLIQDLNLRNGNSTSNGGGIYNRGQLTLLNVTLYNNRTTQNGGAIYNDTSGTLLIRNSTFSGNSASAGVAVYNNSSTAVEIVGSTLYNARSNLAGSTTAKVNVQNSIIYNSSLTGGSQCTNSTSLGSNLVVGGSCFTTPGANDISRTTGQLGLLRDNGGATLTHALPPDSPAINAAFCRDAIKTDQRGVVRVSGEISAASRCDMGAYEYAPAVLTVCTNCTANPTVGRYTDLQTALNRAMAGDTINLAVGSYTGNFIIYKDVTLQHGGLAVATLLSEQSTDVRVILQASTKDVLEQNRLRTPAGSVLQISSFIDPSRTTSPIAPSGDVTVTLRGLTIRNGLSQAGGAIYNLGNLTIYTATLTANAAYNQLESNGVPRSGREAKGGAIYNAGRLTLVRTTVSGNQSEYYGGALYNDGARVATAAITLQASTLLDNRAARLPSGYMVGITAENGFVPSTLPIFSGDQIRFENQTAQARTLTISSAAGVTCQSNGTLDKVQVPAIGQGYSAPLICTKTTAGNAVLTVRDADNTLFSMTLTIAPITHIPLGHVLYRTGGNVTLQQSILFYSEAEGSTCARADGIGIAPIVSRGYNIISDGNVTDLSKLCLTEPAATDQVKLTQAQANQFGPLQDNNQIDFEKNSISGYTDSHAPQPGSTALDAIPPEQCIAVGGQTPAAVVVAPIGESTTQLADQAVAPGTVIVWQNDRTTSASPEGVTIALNSGLVTVQLLPVAVGAQSAEVQFTEPGRIVYQVYDNRTRQAIALGAVVVSNASQAMDQRGVALPQRGRTAYRCDIGAVEFSPWVVGQPMPRPPSAIGTQPPQWQIDGKAVDNQSDLYHGWSGATALDYALRPSAPDQVVQLTWNTDSDAANPQSITQAGIVLWPDAPQLHIATAPVQLQHSYLSDDFVVAGVRAFEGFALAEDQAGTMLSSGVFTRSVLTAVAGDSYSVVRFSKGNASNPTLRVTVVKTVDWNTPGLRDMATAITSCEIGVPLTYPLHNDPEGKNGRILWGTAYDGVRTLAEQGVVVNTVDGAVAPIHVRETRTGAIVPILNQAPTTFANTDPALGGHDLRVAWYLPDGRRVAWPTRAVGYRCDWPQNPPQIVIASELGSEIDGQAILSTDRFVNSTVYQQTNAQQPGYLLNYEHALLAPSNQGNTAPAFYALRTDLLDRNPTRTGVQSYALLKYQDPLQENAAQIAIYAVQLTRQAQSITNSAVTLRAAVGLPELGSTVNVPIDLDGAQGVRTATVRVSYDSTKLTPLSCTPNRTNFVERATVLSVENSGTTLAGGVVRFRARVQAGTDIQYVWNFGDGNVQSDGPLVSHVYGTAGTYTVIVTATNPFFGAALTAQSVVQIDTGSPARALPAVSQSSGAGCRVESPGVLLLDLMARNKHGLSGDLTLATIKFQRSMTAGAPTVTAAATALAGPAYDALTFAITAGNPVFAPVPLRNLLDIQTCSATTANENALPFWKDFKGAIWARAAGAMKVRYFYPLQPGFYLDDDHARSMGLVNDKGQVLSATERVGRCVPWMDKLTGATIATETVADFPTTGQNTKVLPVTYQVSWPELPPLLSVGETVYERAKNGISGVATQAAVTRIYDDLAPGQWVNATQRIALDGTQVNRSLAQLIDPLRDVRAAVGFMRDGNPALPAVIQTAPLLGGGLSLVGNVNNIDLNLPFALRSRVGFDTTTGELIFKGYYDGASPAYLKGDPLLLLNVMAKADKTRLLALCPGESAGCTEYKAAIEQLYWKSLNPRQLDLCRNASGQLYAGDPEPSANQTVKTAAMPACSTSGFYRDNQPDQAFLISVQDADNNGVPEPYEGLGKGKALSAGNAAGTGYITLAYNNDPSLGSLPVSLQVIKIGCETNAQGDSSTYRGNLLVIQSDNLFDEKLTLRHTSDFGGRPDNFTFAWYIAAVDDTGVSPAVQPPNYPWMAWTKIEAGAAALGSEITIEGANPTTLRDNWLLMRYKGYAACGNSYQYSAFAGDPAATPAEVRGQLAEGWIKRVTSALNPFDARVDDFANTSVSTAVDMIQQAGKRYEGPVAMTNDPAVLNQMGLIEAYQTVLNRGRSLSIDSNINDQGANAALLNATSRIASLYMLIANDAYNDALDPTIGLDTTSSVGQRAPTLAAFMNQFNAAPFGLLDEELALLRGRDNTLGGVAAAPSYNRLTWNFTNGDGEVAYVQNYNLNDVNQDGFINEADAAIRYPQGHGDAWGHFLTAVTQYYQLLRHPNYTWVPRAEPLSVGGAPVVVDYYDERRFAIAAAEKAEIGQRIVDLTYRKRYGDPTLQPYVDPLVQTTDNCEPKPTCQQRAWGVADWARRAGQGAFFDWVVTNAILPPTETRYTDLRKIDRSTVGEIGALADEYLAIQQLLDTADRGANPLGLAPNAVLFDLDPALTKTTAETQGKTHYEQVYDRAVGSLTNALTAFNYANEMKMALRNGQHDQRNLAQAILDEDTARVNELIAILGRPYPDDVGVNGTYPAGYTGPDLYHAHYYDRNELTDSQTRCAESERANTDGPCAPQTETYLLEVKSMTCIGNYLTYLSYDEVLKGATCNAATPADKSKAVAFTMGASLEAGRGLFKPSSWSGQPRPVTGEIQFVLDNLTVARLAYEQAILSYQHHLAQIDFLQTRIRDRSDVLKQQGKLQADAMSALNKLDISILALSEAKLVLDGIAGYLDAQGESFANCIPVLVGLVVDAMRPASCAVESTFNGISFGLSQASAALEGVNMGLEYEKTRRERELDLALLKLDADYEIRSMASEMFVLLQQEEELRMELYMKKDDWATAQAKYDNAWNQGQYRLQELIRFRKRWAGQITAQRYDDMAYRLFEIDALQKYRQLFDQAQLYTYLTALAYDYETNLTDNDDASGQRFIRQIAAERLLGEFTVLPGGSLVPVPGDRGLAGALGKMRSNFDLLKGQMGFNNPQDEVNRFSLRHELFRLTDASDAKWQQTLARYYTPNIYSNPLVARMAKPAFGEPAAVPGLVIPFGTNIRSGLNFFGLVLGVNDSAYDASQFATKIASVGIWFDGYDTTRLAQTPRVYLLPAGKDVLRPRNANGELRYWHIAEQLLPQPYALSASDLNAQNWLANVNALNGQLFANKPYARLRAYPYRDDLEPDELNTDTRLIGRSVWNTQWLLVIPGTTLLGDPALGTERFIQDVDDIYIYFQSYAYAGTDRASQ